MNKFEKTLHFIKQTITPDSPFYGQIYLVGGCVRDELLGERYTDVDLLINLPEGQKAFVNHMCATYPKTCKGPFYYQRYGTTAMDVIIDGSLTLVECVEPHIEEYADDGQTLLETRFCTLEEDSRRRDYTCNALYKNLHSGEVLDPTGRGVNDLRNGLLITPGEPGSIYRQDPVRMLRGIRFKHQKGFRIDAQCWEAIKANHATMAIAAPKRLRDELNKLLKSPTFAEGVNDLYECGLLEYVMPGMEAFVTDTTPLPNAPEGLTAWQHTRQAMLQLCQEHPHADSHYRLALLVMDFVPLHGRRTVADVLAKAGIGKERLASIMHITDLYYRFAGMYEDGIYVARPRELPHFLNALGPNRSEFRRMVRALNNGLFADAALPWRALFEERGPAPSGAPRRRRSTKAGPTTAATAPQSQSAEEANSERRRKRNRKRRDQRKRARIAHSKANGNGATPDNIPQQTAN